MITCEKCPKWSEYKDDYGTDYSEKIPDNCSTWLCNDGSCPQDPQNNSSCWSIDFQDKLFNEMEKESYSEIL